MVIWQSMFLCCHIWHEQYHQLLCTELCPIICCIEWIGERARHLQWPVADIPRCRATLLLNQDFVVFILFFAYLYGTCVPFFCPCHYLRKLVKCLNKVMNEPFKTIKHSRPRKIALFLFIVNELVSRKLEHFNNYRHHKL